MTPCLVQATVTEDTDTGTGNVTIKMSNVAPDTEDENEPPVIKLFASGDQISAGKAITLNASQSYDPDGDPDDPLDFQWSLEDGKDIVTLTATTGPVTQLAQARPVNMTTPIHVVCTVSDGEKISTKTALITATTEAYASRTAFKSLTNVEVDPEVSVMGLSHESTSGTASRLAVPLISLVTLLAATCH
eukprot:Blabericola_migrator_1__12227@NODE_760_length_6627_cov_45_648933_g83_i2_p4_GENE_NODE_760_length_6627_cov_45_648933_g83_i2NODE_760_length_6627_cov_45_648933_g83_i2_p4_ORF_typecomplete_len189_score40_38REJ/PF02010_15/7_7e11Big_9/PF17963_1/1_5VWA_N2/PF16164_5/2e02VWA_N2/PF16164_5/9_2VWA_N2/PF16164_5/5_7e02_NODE_760_length_6627_cov_45_648933_g83_i230023568